MKQPSELRDDYKIEWGLNVRGTISEYIYSYYAINWQAVPAQIDSL